MQAFAVARPAALQRLAAAVNTHVGRFDLAEDWDNVGILVDHSEALDERVGSDSFPYRVLITNDASLAVVDEAVTGRYHALVSYHPTPFLKFNKLLHTDVTSQVVLRLVRNNVALVSPHSGSDAVPHGVNGWLAGLVAAAAGHAGAADAAVPIESNKGDPAVGAGRRFDLGAAVGALDTVKQVKKALALEAVRVSVCDGRLGKLGSDREFSKVAVCAGAGSAVFRALADVHDYLLVTGELSHHDMLGLAQRGAVVALVEHSNSERGFLAVAQQRLDSELGDGFSLDVSQLDRDPVSFVV